MKLKKVRYAYILKIRTQLYKFREMNKDIFQELHSNPILKKSKCAFAPSVDPSHQFLFPRVTVNGSPAVLFAFTADLPFALLSKASVSSSAALTLFSHRPRPTSLRAIWSDTPLASQLEPKMNGCHGSPPIVHIEVHRQ